MARRDEFARLARRAESGDDEVLARVEREVAKRGSARYRVVVTGRVPGEPAPTPFAEPVVYEREFRQSPAWSIPLATAGGVWSVMRDYGGRCVAFYDAVEGDVISFEQVDASADAGTAVLRARLLPHPVVPGSFTSRADVLCYQCQGTRSGRGEKVTELLGGEVVTKCDRCGRDTVVDWKVGHEHQMVLALRGLLADAPGFADPPAVMEQTGGMCSAFSVRFEEDPDLALLFVVDEERQDDDVVFLPWLQDDADHVGPATVGLPGLYRTVRELAGLAMDLVDPEKRRSAYSENAEAGYD